MLVFILFFLPSVKPIKFGCNSLGKCFNPLVENKSTLNIPSDSVLTWTSTEEDVQLVPGCSFVNKEQALELKSSSFEEVMRFIEQTPNHESPPPRWWQSG